MKSQQFALPDHMVCEKLTIDILQCLKRIKQMMVLGNFCKLGVLPTLAFSKPHRHHVNGMFMIDDTA
jgi:hypothetical protein